MTNQKEIEILKSPNDKNSYRYIKLENEIEVILISDSITDYASCCLSVGVGSLSNPKDIDGLAHFLEHMLFLGTEKYPVEKEFIDFISKHSGSYNATTSPNKTSYFYKVNQESLKESLDRFSSFFISPLMNEDAVDRELKAVDSEHNNNKQSEVWRMDRMINDQFEGHPLSRFFTGNEKTLKIPGIRERVVEFYNQFYSANLMKIALYGKESLDELEQLAREYFSSIKNKNVERPTFEPLKLKQSIWLEVESKQYDIIKFVFPIDDPSVSFQNYKDQSATILSHIMGHESEGSLLSVLVEKNYATNLTFGESSTGPTINKMELSIFLTPLGKENLDEIVGLMFQYTDNVQFPKYCYDEKKLISDVNWSKFQRSDPQSVTTTISHHLLKVESPSDVIKYNHFWSDFSPENMEKIRSFIRPDNMIAMCYMKEIKGGTAQIEPIYKINFNKRAVTDQDIAKWRAVPKSDKLYIPGPNPFIPDDFSIKAPQDGKICVPELAYDNNGITIFHSMDHRFNTPKARVFIKFETPLHGNTYNMVCCNFLRKSLKTVLNEKILYYLAVLEYDMKMLNYVTHLQLSSYGYSDKIFLALEEVFKFFYTFDLTEEQFEKIRVKVEKRTETSYFIAPYLMTTTENNLYLLNSNGSLNDRSEIIKTLTRENFISYVKSFFSYLNLTVLVVGNITKEESQNFGKTLNQFNRVKLAPNDAFTLSRVSIPEHTEYHLLKHVYDKEQTNNASSTFCLIGNGYSRKHKAIALFLNQVMYRAYFDELRTKQQFGYIVTLSLDSNANTQGLRFIVQSHTKSPDEIYDATSKFLLDFGENELLEYKKQPEVFQSIVESIQKSLVAKTYNNRSQAQVYWNNYDAAQDFEYDKIMCEEMSKLTIDEVIDAYNQFISPSSTKRRCFVVKLYSHSLQFDINSKPQKENIKYIPDNKHAQFRKQFGFISSSNKQLI